MTSAVSVRPAETMPSSRWQSVTLNHGNSTPMRFKPVFVIFLLESCSVETTAAIKAAVFCREQQQASVWSSKHFPINHTHTRSRATADEGFCFHRNISSPPERRNHARKLLKPGCKHAHGLNTCEMRHSGHSTLRVVLLDPALSEDDAAVDLSLWLSVFIAVVAAAAADIPAAAAAVVVEVVPERLVVVLVSAWERG